MTMSRSALRRCAFTFLVIAGLLLIAAPIVLANVRVGGGDLPFYARLARGEIYHNDDWAVIVFYRPPTCIPTDFNLLDLFDAPGAFGCTPNTTAGFEIWKNGPGIDPAPIVAELQGLGAVPVWFVSWPALQAAIADDALTIGDLEAMRPLVGSATFYHETIRPYEAVKLGTIEFNASGMLLDGRSFQLKAIRVENPEIGDFCGIHCKTRIVSQ